MRALLLITMSLLFPLSAFAGVQKLKFDQDGIARDYLLYVPNRLPADRPAPLILVMHGGGGSSAQILRSTGGRFNELAEDHGFIVAYPNAFRRI